MQSFVQRYRARYTQKTECLLGFLLAASIKVYETAVQLCQTLDAAQVFGRVFENVLAEKTSWLTVIIATTTAPHSLS
jgi:hypothetical protein